MANSYRKTGVLTGFLLLCFSLAVLFIQAKKGEVLHSIAFAGLSWIGYLVIHKSDTGRILDTMETIEKHVDRKEEIEWKPQKRKALTGPLVFVTGMFIGSRGVIWENYILAFFGAAGVIGGYAIFHYFMEGELF